MTEKKKCSLCDKPYFSTTKHARAAGSPARSLCGAYFGTKDEKYVDNPADTSCQSCAIALKSGRPRRSTWEKPVRPIHHWKWIAGKYVLTCGYEGEIDVTRRKPISCKRCLRKMKKLGWSQ